MTEIALWSIRYMTFYELKCLEWSVEDELSFLSKKDSKKDNKNLSCLLANIKKEIAERGSGGYC